MIVCLYALALCQTGDLLRVYPDSWDRLHPHCDPELDKRMDENIVRNIYWSCFHVKVEQMLINVSAVLFLHCPTKQVHSG